MLTERRGQSLIEVLIAVVIGAVMVGAVATVIAPALRSDTQINRSQTAAALGKGLLDNVRVLSESNWLAVASLAGPAVAHYLTSTPPVAVPGIEVIVIATTTYRRYFYAETVLRDSSSNWNGNILTTGGSVDPSTKKITVFFHWPPAGTSTIVQYLTRYRNNFFSQSDWSGGPNQTGPVTSTSNRFATSTNVNYTTTTGALIIQGF